MSTAIVSRAWRSPDLGSLVLVALVSACAGLALTYWPLEFGAGLAAIAFLCAVSRSQAPFMASFLTFLVVQNPLIVFAGGEDSTAGYLLKRSDELILILYAGGVLLLNQRVRTLLTNRPLMIAIGGCYFGMIASTLLRGGDPIPCAIDLLLFSKPFLLLAVGASLGVTPLDMRKQTTPLMLIMLSVALFALVFIAAPDLQDAFIGDYRGPDNRVGMVSAQGFFDGPGPYSWFCGVSFAFSYAAYLVYKRKRYLFGSIVSAACLLLAWRRKSIAGLFLMLVLAAILRDVNQRRRVRAAFALALLLVGAFTILAPYFGEIIAYTMREYGGFDPLANARLALHYTSVLIARDHFPFGTGLASFGSHASRIYYSDVYAEYGLSSVWGLSREYSAFITDTFWPMVLGEGGVICCAAYVAFLSILVRAAWRAARSTLASGDERFFATFVLLALVGSLLESTSSHIYDSTMESALVMVPSGLLLGIAAGRSSAESRSARASDGATELSLTP